MLVQKGDLDWSSDSATDYDSDGCQDSAEDMDDDNDLVMDSSDACMKGDLSWSSDPVSDYDSDGCQILQKIWMMTMIW